MLVYSYSFYLVSDLVFEVLFFVVDVNVAYFVDLVKEMERRRKKSLGLFLSRNDDLSVVQSRPGYLKVLT